MNGATVEMVATTATTATKNGIDRSEDKIDQAELSELAGDLSALHPELELLHDRQDDFQSDWIEGLELADAPKPPRRRVVTDPDERRAALLVPPGSRGLHRVLATSIADGLVVSARVRGVNREAPRPSLHVSSLDVAPAPGDPRRALLDAHRSRGKERYDVRPSRSEASVSASPDRGDAWQTIVLFLSPDPRRQALRLSVDEGTGALVDEVVVRRATLLETIGAERARLDPTPAHPLVASLRVADFQSRALLLPAGTRVIFEVDVPTKAPRIDAALHSHPRATARRVSVRCSVDGATIDEREADPDAAHLAGWTVPLERFAGRRVALAFTADGEAGSVAALCDPWLLAGETTRPGPSVLLISIDTLRRDALGCMGHDDARTTAIDQLAAAGTRFTRATSPVSFTLPAHTSLFSGQHPLEHGVTDAGRTIDPARTPMLAERLAAAGWQTAAFTGGGLVHAEFGFARGFGSYAFRDFSGVDGMFQPEPAALAAGGRRFAGAARLFDWLDRRADQPFFLFVHTYFVHNYVPSADFADRRAARLRPDVALAADGSRAIDLRSRLLELETQPGIGAELRRLYQAAVEEVDARLVAPLLQELDRLRIADDTIVVLVSDHGEEFQEHERLFHGKCVWNESVDVPLILRGPGIPRGARRDDVARLEDVAPTLAALLGLPPDERSLGRDLFASSASDDADPSPRLLHLSNRDRHDEYRWDGLALGRYTLLRHHLSAEQRRDYLFDTSADPREQHDLAPTRSDELLRLGRRLDAEIRRTLENATRLPSSAADGARADGDELERRLRELGYGIK